MKNPIKVRTTFKDCTKYPLLASIELIIRWTDFSMNINLFFCRSWYVFLRGIRLFSIEFFISLVFDLVITIFGLGVHCLTYNNQLYHIKTIWLILYNFVILYKVWSSSVGLSRFETFRYFSTNLYRRDDFTGKGQRKSSNLYYKNSHKKIKLSLILKLQARKPKPFDIFWFFVNVVYI